MSSTPPLPCVVHVGFAGSRALFPSGCGTPEQLAELRKKLTELVKSLQEEIDDGSRFLCGISQLAAGADFLFAEICQERCIPHRLFLPQNPTDYLSATVSKVPDFTDPQRAEAEKLLARDWVIQVRAVSHSPNRDIRFQETNFEIVRLSDIVICLLAQSEAEGGTVAVLEQAKTRGIPVIEVRVGVKDDKLDRQEIRHNFATGWVDKLPAIPKELADAQLAPPPSTGLPTGEKAAVQKELAGAQPAAPPGKALPPGEEYVGALKAFGSSKAWLRKLLFHYAALTIVVTHIAATVCATRVLVGHGTEQIESARAEAARPHLDVKQDQAGKEQGHSGAKTDAPPGGKGTDGPNVKQDPAGNERGPPGAKTEAASGGPVPGAKGADGPKQDQPGKESSPPAAKTDAPPGGGEPVETSAPSRKADWVWLLCFELFLLAIGFAVHQILHHSGGARHWAVTRLTAEVTRSVRSIAGRHQQLDYLFRLPFPLWLRPVLRTLNVLLLNSTRPSGSDWTKWEQVGTPEAEKQLLPNGDAVPSKYVYKWERDRDTYLETRVDVSRAFYRERLRSMNFWLWVASIAFVLFVIAAGLATAVKLGAIGGWPERLSLLSEEAIGWLGAAAIVFPVLAVGALSLAAVMDCYARYHTYSDMLPFLDEQEKLLRAVRTAHEFEKVVLETELRLLGETVGWYQRRFFTQVS
jgi:hypothetical protein